jgi:hypothetical protein
MAVSNRSRQAGSQGASRAKGGSRVRARSVRSKGSAGLEGANKGRAEAGKGLRSRALGVQEEVNKPRGSLKAVLARADVWGFLLAVIGVLSMMAIWAGSLGPVGHGFRVLCALIMGWVSELVPLLALVGGILAIRGHARARRALHAGELVGPLEENPGEARVSSATSHEANHAVLGRASQSGRHRHGASMASEMSSPAVSASVRAVALVLVLWALCGLGDIAAGSLGPNAKSHAIEQAGGYLGALLGAGLHAAIGSPGAVVVLVGCVVLGSVLAAATSVGQAVRYLWLGASWVWELAFSGFSRVFSRAGRIGGVAPSASGLQNDLGASSSGELMALQEGRYMQVGQLQGMREWGAAGMHSGPDTAELVLADPGSQEQPLSEFVSNEDSIDRHDEHSYSLDAADEPPSGPEGPKGDSRVRMLGLRSWKRPDIALLGRGAMRRQDPKAVEDLGHRLVSALASHGVATRLVGQSVGPTVTRYELELAPGVKVARVTSLSKDIAYALASPDVRILAPIPGKSAIGIEVPNVSRQVVTLGDVLSSREAKAAKGPMQVPLGCDVSGRVAVVDLTEMPHLLISGATGSGKSSCINALLVSLLLRATPEEVRMVLIDPKRVELSAYEGLPHLLTSVVVDPKRAAQALAWAVREMERRYRVLAAVGARDIRSYSRAMQEARQALRTPAGEVPEGFEAMPYVLVVVDELHDLMMVAARDVEDYVCRLAQMARAVGIHLILATQRPSVDVITGVIKANIPSRLAFAVSSLADSRVILDQPGAERLVGKGDMLLVTASSSVPIRLQGPWVEEAEVRRVTAFWRRQGAAGGEMQLSEIPEGRKPDASEEDDLLEEAMALVVKSQLGSTSMLQRKLRVGFARAGRLMDLLERRGVVGPSEGSKARVVLMTPEELPEHLRGDPS